MKISVVIPALNEEKTIGNVVRQAKNRASGNIGEIIVVDGGSHDATAEKAAESGAKVIGSDKKGRAIQMNAGAAKAVYPVLYFLHADSLPPFRFDQKIVEAVNRGHSAGCFQLAFDQDHPLLNFYAWCTRFDINAFRYGDQSLFIEKDLFDHIGGYEPGLQLMEDNVIVRRLKKETFFEIISDKVVTSARKYRTNGMIRLQLIFTLIYVLFFLGFPQERLVSTYRALIAE